MDVVRARVLQSDIGSVDRDFLCTGLGWVVPLSEKSRARVVHVSDQLEAIEEGEQGEVVDLDLGLIARDGDGYAAPGFTRSVRGDERDRFGRHVFGDLPGQGDRLLGLEITGKGEIEHRRTSKAEFGQLGRGANFLSEDFRTRRGHTRWPRDRDSAGRKRETGFSNGGFALVRGRSRTFPCAPDHQQQHGSHHERPDLLHRSQDRARGRPRTVPISGDSDSGRPDHVPAASDQVGIRLDLTRLHRQHKAWRFSGIDSPPREIGMM